MVGACIGDSLAVGIAGVLHCMNFAQSGMSSCWARDHVPMMRTDWAVISAGTNDPPGPCLEALRGRVLADKVIWVLPVEERWVRGARAHVARVAALHGDHVCGYTSSVGGWPHPTNYNALATCVAGYAGVRAK